MINEVFVVEEGEYSDRKVVAVFLDWDEARTYFPEECITSFKPGVPEGTIVEYLVEMQLDGEVLECDTRIVDKTSEEVHNNRYGRRFNDLFYFVTSVYTDRGMNAAVEIANERRLKFKAENPSPEQYFVELEVERERKRMEAEKKKAERIAALQPNARNKITSVGTVPDMIAQLPPMDPELARVVQIAIDQYDEEEIKE